MSEQVVSSLLDEGTEEFWELLEARASEIHVMTGKVGRSNSGERVHSEIQIAIPSERTIAEIQYRTPDGLVRRKTMTEKQVSIIPAGQPYKFSWPRGDDLTLVRIAPDFLKGVARACGLRAAEVVGHYGAFDPVLWHLGRELRAELRRHRKLDSAYLQSVATVLTRYLVSTYVTAVPPLERGGLPRFKLRQAIEYIHEKMASDISFRDVASHLQMSSYHFARLFKQSTGQSLHRYIVRCRIERAKALLVEAKLPISGVAFEVGYKSQSHFATCFGRVTGVTPSAFRAGN